MINALKQHSVQRLQVRMYPRISFLGDFVTTWEWIFFEESIIDLMDTNRKEKVSNQQIRTIIQKTDVLLLKYTSSYNGNLFVVYKSFVRFFLTKELVANYAIPGSGANISRATDTPFVEFGWCHLGF